ncbi:staygreen family protein [Clostridium sp. DL1XJH146]
MKKLDSQKLDVTFLPGVNEWEPIVPRCYTLTHSDFTGKLFLSIGLYYDYVKIGYLRDEVLGKWLFKNKKFILNIYLYVNGEKSITEAKIRDYFFRKELVLALEAIRYGDSKFFECHNFLDKAPVIIHFNSKFDKYNKEEHWGIVGDYK